ncbi:MAG: hypothetical protein J0L92_09000 [Deltaproteobacteria bacterium]|nr:hypothetical protein [Deltaproteobacteria bacterium]
MGLGNLFDGATEDLILHVIAPSSLAALVTGLAVVEWHLSRRFAAAAESWRDPHAPRVESSDADYRAPASSAAGPRAPRAVRWLARLALLWSAVTLVGFGGLAVVTFAVLGALAALLVPLGAAFAAASVVHAVLVLPERSDPRVRPRIARARTALVMHHALVVLASLAAVIPLFVSGVDLGDIGLGTLVLVLIPCTLGAALYRRLDTVRSLYSSPA